jgi:hypothetical protein
MKMFAANAAILKGGKKLVIGHEVSPNSSWPLVDLHTRTAALSTSSA